VNKQLIVERNDYFNQLQGERQTAARWKEQSGLWSGHAEKYKNRYRDMRARADKVRDDHALQMAAGKEMLDNLLLDNGNMVQTSRSTDIDGRLWS